jgi:hypothetical protein
MILSVKRVMVVDGNNVAKSASALATVDARVVVAVVVVVVECELTTAGVTGSEVVRGGECPYK